MFMWLIMMQYMEYTKGIWWIKIVKIDKRRHKICIDDNLKNSSVNMNASRTIKEVSDDYI